MTNSNSKSAMFIKELRLKNNLSVGKLAKELEISQPQLTRIENGTRAITIGIAKKFEKYFNIPAQKFLFPEENIILNTNKTINIYGYASCGIGVFNDDTIIDTIDLNNKLINNNNHNDFFGVYAQGDSMINARIEDNDLLIFKKTEILNNGQIGTFALNGEALVKIFKKYNNQIVLQSANEKYEDIIVNENDDFKIVGTLKHIIINL